MTARARFLLGLGLLAACDSPPPPAPDLTILDVTPLSQRTHETKTVRLQLNADPAFVVNYDTSEAHQVNAPVLTLGTQPVPLSYLGHGVFEGTVGPLARGTYPVAVRLDGREATFTKTYNVTALGFSYEFGSLPPQVSGQPFTAAITVSLRGQVPVPPPSRTARLTVFSGSRDYFSLDLGPFVPGEVLRPSITLTATGDDFVARLEDSEGERAYSNAFPVAPPKQ